MKSKTCSKCNEEKPLKDFYKQKTGKLGRRADCKICFCKRANSYTKKWRKENTEKHREYRRKYMRRKRNNDPVFRMVSHMRSRLWEILKQEKSDKTKDLLGCSLKKLKQHLEEQFDEEMNWDNYGEWHVDHIKPCASFDFSKEGELKKCFHYTNLQPLWAEDNIRKHNKIMKNARR